MATPNVFVIGSAKCATTSVHQIFNDYCLDVSCGVRKENRYFMRDYWLGQQELDRLYPRDNKVVLDFQPSNCLYPWVAERIKETCPDAKVILIIREPIARAYSHIQHFRSMRPGRLAGSPDNIIMENLKTFNSNKFPDEYSYMRQADPAGGNYEHTFLELGDYHRIINRFKDFKIRIVFFEDFVYNSRAFIADLCDFMNIDSFNFETPHLNSKSNGGKFGEGVYHTLREFYRERNTLLSGYFGINVEDFWHE